MAKIIIYIPIFLLFLQNIFSLPIDLNKRDVYVRLGFQKNWTAKLPQGKEWLKVNASQSGMRTIRVSALAIPGLSKLESKLFTPNPFKTFTYVTSFELSNENLKSGKFLGLLLRQIGENWEVYLNGNLIKKEVYLSDQGKIETIRIIKDALIELPGRFLRTGENILAFKILGDPASKYTGFSLSGTYLIDEYQNLLEQKSSTKNIILMAIFAFIGLYHILLFLRNPKSFYNLYFSLFALDYVVLIFFLKSNISYDYIFNSDIILRGTIIPIYSGAIFFACVFSLLLFEEIHKITKIIILLIILTLPFMFFLNREYLQLAGIWISFLEVTVGIYLFFYKGMISFFSLLKRQYGLLKNEQKFSRLLKSVYLVLTKTVIGNLIIGISLIFITILLEILFLVVFQEEIDLVSYNIVLIFLGMTFIITNKYEDIYKKNVLYRSLVDLFPEFIAIIHKGIIQFINASGITMLGAKTSLDIIGRHLNEFVQPAYHAVIGEIRSDRVNDKEPLKLTDIKFVNLDKNIMDVEILCHPFQFDGKSSVQIIASDVTLRNKAIKEENKRIGLEKELALIKERQAIFTDLHDHLGSRLTDIAILTEKLSPKHLDSGMHSKKLKDKVLETITEFRELLQNVEDSEIMKKDFFQGLHLLLLRRYSNKNRPLKFHADFSVNPGELIQIIGTRKEDLLAVCQEICSNDLKYGEGLSLWNFFQKDGCLELKMSTQSIYELSKQRKGYGTKNIQRRIGDHGGEVKTKLDKGNFLMEIKLPLEE